MGWFSRDPILDQMAAQLTDGIRKLDSFGRKLDRLIASQKSFQRDEVNFMSALDDSIAALSAKVNKCNTIIDSTDTFVRGIPALIADAVAKAQTAGATPEQLQALNDLGAALEAKADQLAADVVANTPSST